MIPISIVILIGLFLVQSRGTAKVGIVFGPVILVYLAALAVLGVTNIMAHPEIVGALNPFWAVRFFLYNPKLAFLALGSVFLAVTGAETLYADMGHFGRRAIGFSWLALVMSLIPAIDVEAAVAQFDARAVVHDGIDEAEVLALHHGGRGETKVAHREVGLRRRRHREGDRLPIVGLFRSRSSGRNCRPLPTACAGRR